MGLEFKPLFDPSEHLWPEHGSEQLNIKQITGLSFQLTLCLLYEVGSNRQVGR